MQNKPIRAWAFICAKTEELLIERKGALAIYEKKPNWLGQGEAIVEVEIRHVKRKKR